MRTDFNNSFTVVLGDEPYRKLEQNSHRPLNLLPLYLVKVECSSVQLFIHAHTGQNNLHSIRS